MRVQHILRTAVFEQFARFGENHFKLFGHREAALQFVQHANRVGDLGKVLLDRLLREAHAGLEKAR